MRFDITTINIRVNIRVRGLHLVFKLPTSKTKQFCQTFFKNGKLSAELTASYHCILQVFQSICLKYGACHEKVMPGHTKCCTCHAKSSQQTNLKIWCSKMQPLSGNQRPDLLTALMNISLVLRLPREIDLCRSSSNVPRLPLFLEMLQNPHVLLTFNTVHNPLRLPRETTLQSPKVARACCAFNIVILASKCASHHNNMHFFDITTSKSGLNMHILDISISKSGPSMVCFVHSCHNGVHFFDISISKSGPELQCFVQIDLEMCFAPQRRAIFHLSSGQLAPHPPL